MLLAGLRNYRNTTFENRAEKPQLAELEILQTCKTSPDAGDTIDLYELLSKIVGVFKHDEQEDESTLQAAVSAATTCLEQPSCDILGPSGAGGAPTVASYGNGKCRLAEEETYSTSSKSEVLEKLLKAINDLKSDIGFIKKYFVGYFGINP